jgi:hypothetical protein
MINYSKFFVHIFAYLDIFWFKGHIFLITRAYFKFLVHILIVHRKSNALMNIFHESRSTICYKLIKTTEINFILK